MESQLSIGFIAHAIWLFGLVLQLVHCGIMGLLLSILSGHLSEKVLAAFFCYFCNKLPTCILHVIKNILNFSQR